MCSEERRRRNIKDMLCFFGDGSGKQDVLFFFFWEGIVFLCFSEEGVVFLFLLLSLFLSLSFFFFFFKGSDSKGTVINGLITVLRTVRLNRGLNGYLFFWYRTVFEHKRTVIVRGSRFFRSDRTVRSGFQNHVFNYSTSKHSSLTFQCIAQFKLWNWYCKILLKNKHKRSNGS